MSRRVLELDQALGAKAAAAVLLCLFLLSGPAWAENGTKQQKTRITSERVIYSGGNRTIDFRGDVYVKRSDFSIWCDWMRVHMAREDAEGDMLQEAQGSPRNFEKIVARENVRLQMGEREASCREAVYLPGEELLTLRGEVRLRQGKSRIRGSEVRIHLDTNSSEVIGGNEGRVEATFYSSNSTGPSNGDSEGD